MAIHYKPTASGAGQDAVKLDKDAFGMSDCHYLESEYTADPYLQMYPRVLLLPWCHAITPAAEYEPHPLWLTSTWARLSTGMTLKSR